MILGFVALLESTLLKLGGDTTSNRIMSSIKEK